MNGPSDRSSFILDCLDRTNEHRGRHGVPGLGLNPRLSSVAQAWAEHLLRSRSMAHNPSARYMDEPLGENVAYNYKSHGLVTGSEMIDQWYNEIKDYNFNSHTSSGVTGHFTQLVWKETREVGFGLSCSGGKYFLVANYYPAGNYVGRHRENVFPPQSEKSSARAPTTIQSPTRRPSQQQQQPSPSARVVVAENRPKFHKFKWSFSFNDGNVEPADQSNFSKNPTDPSTNDSTNLKSSSPPPPPSFRKYRQPEEWSRMQGCSGNVHSDASGPLSGMNPNERTVRSTFDDLDPNGHRGIPSEQRTTEVTRRHVTNLIDGFENAIKTTTTTTRTTGTGPIQRRLENAAPTSQKQAEKTEVAEVERRFHVARKEGRQFADAVVSGHNRLRSRHKAPGLRLNDEISQLAQRWADRLAAADQLTFSGHKFQGQQLGEGIGMKYSSAQVDYEASELVDNWYKERDHYNFDFPNERDGVSRYGHFTQMVWRGSREIGVGRAWSRDGRRVVVVCNYLPSGNVIGSFRENVLET